MVINPNIVHMHVLVLCLPRGFLLYFLLYKYWLYASDF